MTFKPDMTLWKIKKLCELHEDEACIFSVGTMKTAIQAVQLLESVLVQRDEDMKQLKQKLKDILKAI